MPHPEVGPLATGAIDSSDPIIGDMLYRLDDEQQQYREREHQGVSDQPPPPTETDDHLAWLKGRPWWKKPSPYWLIPLSTLLAIASGSIASSKVELFTQIVCEEMRSHQPSAGVLRFPHERPPMGSECRKPHIVAGSADLQMKITITMGVLSALTTGWWGGLSDRRGRTKVLLCAVAGLLTGDISCLAVGLLPVTKLPFGTHFMLISSVFEGLLGGVATIIAAHQAYVSDSTPAGTRARIFAQMTGCFFFGYVLGPVLGGYMTKLTDSLMSTFVFATSVHLTYIFLIVFIVPESVSPERKRAAMAHYYNDVGDKRQNPAEANDGQQSDTYPTTTPSPASSFRQVLLARILVPLRPLMMLLPREVDEVERLQSRPATPMPSIAQLRSAGTEPPATHPAASASHISVSHISRKRKRDWNLFWLSLSYALIMGCMGLITVKALYAQEEFDWGPSELGLYLSVVSIARVLALTCVLPVVIKIWHRPPKSVALPQDSTNTLSDETVALLGDDGRISRRQSVAGYGSTDDMGDRVLLESESVTAPAPGQESFAAGNTAYEDTESLFAPEHHASMEELWTLRAKHLRMIHDSHFDLKLTRISFLFDCICYLMLSLFRGPVVFVAASCLLALGSGSSAAMSSLALAFLHRPSEAGNLFGAWSIVSALASTVLGPLFFTWAFKLGPHNIFWAGEAVLVAAFACTLMIRVRKPRSLPALPPRPPSRKPSLATAE